MTAPPELRELDEKIAGVRRSKEAAIDGQDFEKAASLVMRSSSSPPSVPSVNRLGRMGTWTLCRGR